MAYCESVCNFKSIAVKAKKSNIDSAISTRVKWMAGRVCKVMKSGKPTNSMRNKFDDEAIFHQNAIHKTRRATNEIDTRTEWMPATRYAPMPVIANGITNGHLLKRPNGRGPLDILCVTDGVQVIRVVSNCWIINENVSKWNNNNEWVLVLYPLPLSEWTNGPTDEREKMPRADKVKHIEERKCLLRTLMER